MLVLLPLLAVAALDVPLPPPPPGMKQVALADSPQAASPAPAAAEKADSEDPSTELEEMRALEAVELDPNSRSDAAVRELLHRLGYGSPLRERLKSALDDAETSTEVPFSLAPVTDLLNFDVSQVKDRYDIPVEMQPLVAQYIHFFQSGGRKWFRHWMSRSTRYIPMMTPILVEVGVPKDTVYLAMIESGFSTAARSWAAAVGPWQFIAETGKRYGLQQDFWVDERRDPVKATHAAAQYLKELYSDHGHWYLAWAGYNSGGNRVKWMVERYGSHDFWQLSDQKVGFAKETKHYVPKLIACALVARYPEAFGFSPEEFDFEQPLEFDEVKLTTQVDLEVLSRVSGATLEQLQELNPEIKRWCTPPASAERPYTLRVPKGAGETTVAAMAKLPPAERLNFKIHKVKKGDTLSGIAQQYASAPEAIMRVNGIKSARSLKLNADLLIPVPSAAAMKAGKVDPVLERQAARARRSGLSTRPEDEIPAGTVGTRLAATGGTVTSESVGGKTRVTYGVAVGDSLWSIAQRFDVSVADLRNWNEHLPQKKRGLQVGTAMTIWPGPKADLTPKK